MKAAQLKQQLYEELSGQILKGERLPGELLPSQRVLAQQCELSRESVREVVQQLELDGLIATRQGGRSQCLNLVAQRIQMPDAVAADNLELQIKVMEARAFLEGEAAYFAALRATPAQLDALAEEYAKMQRRGRGTTTLDKAKADLRFHMLIAESSHHMLIIAFSQLFYHRYFNAIYGVLNRTLIKFGRYPDGIRMQHEQIYEAIMQRDAQAARRLATEHILYTKRKLEEAE